MALHAQPPESREIGNLSLVYFGKLLHGTDSRYQIHCFDMQMYRELPPSYSCEHLVPCFKKSEWNNKGAASLQDHGLREDFTAFNPSLLAPTLQLPKPHSQEEIKILVTELSLRPKVNSQTCLYTPQAPVPWAQAFRHRKSQTETSVFSSCQTLHHSLDLSSVLLLLCSSRESGRYFGSQAPESNFTRVQRYIKVSRNTQKLGLGALHYRHVKGQWRAPNMALKQTQATFWKSLHLLKKVPFLTRGISNHQVWHTWMFRKASYTQTQQMWGKVLKRQASWIPLIIKHYLH